jgi:hypothetical protein
VVWTFSSPGRPDSRQPPDGAARQVSAPSRDAALAMPPRQHGLGNGGLAQGCHHTPHRLPRWRQRATAEVSLTLSRFTQDVSNPGAQLVMVRIAPGAQATGDRPPHVGLRRRTLYPLSYRDTPRWSLAQPRGAVMRGDRRPPDGVSWTDGTADALPWCMVGCMLAATAAAALGGQRQVVRSCRVRRILWSAR